MRVDTAADASTRPPVHSYGRGKWEGGHLTLLRFTWGGIYNRVTQGGEDLPDDQTSPQRGVMLRLRLRDDELRANDVSNAVRDKDRSSHEALLRVASDVGHSQGNNQSDNRAEETDDGVSDNRGGSVIRPGRLPDHSHTCNDGQTAEHKHDDAGVRDLGSNPASQGDEDEADSTEGELPEDGLEGGPAEGGDDKGTEAADGTVDGVCRGHHDEDEPDFGVEQGLFDVRPLQLLAANTHLASSKTLNSHDPLVGGEEPCGDGRAGDNEAPQSEDERQRSGKEVDVLPSLQRAARDLRKSVVQGTTNDREQTSTREPPGLSQ